MEKGSEKYIKSNRLQNNIFNNLLSQVQIKIDDLKDNKKFNNYVLEMDSNIDKSNSNVNYFDHANNKNEKNGCKNDKNERNVFRNNKDENMSKNINHNIYVINAPLKTRNSSNVII